MSKYVIETKNLTKAEVRSFIRGLCTEWGKTILISSHILSEIALLADDIGIIDHGALLEEESLEDYFKRVTGVRGLLDLVKCEFWKIKRKGLFKIALFTAVLFPVFNIMPLSEGRLADVMSSVREESGFLLLIPILVIIAANLFFEEHDNDTLKNLICVPVSKSHLVIAKVTVLFLFSVAYEMLGFCISILIAFAQGDRCYI